MTAVDPSAHRAVVRDTTRWLADLEPEAGARPVPACPGWDVDRLLGHLGRVHQWVALAVATPPGDDIPAPPRRPDGEDPRAWLATSVRLAEAALDGVDPATPVSTWAGLQTAGWWRRRLAFESLVHAWDVADALGRPGPTVRGEVAADGIDEVLDVFLAHRFDLDGFGVDVDAALHLHALDAEGEWLLRFEPGAAPTVTTEHAKGDAALRGPALELFLWSWNRRGTDAEGLEVFGDRELLDRYQAASRY